MVKEVLVYWWGELIQNQNTEKLKKGDENVKDYVVEKLKEVLVFMQYYWWEEVIHWVDKVFPPETRGDKFSHWVQVGKPFLIAGLVVVMLICCLKCCCGGGRSVRMMKAPGRNARMPRNVFERNPRSYFQDLWEEVIQWVHTVFAPETTVKFNYWIQVGTPFLVAWLVLLLLMFCCKCCGRGGGGRSERTMRAPGRNHGMPRNEFERNPGSYFRNLRARNR